MKLSADPFRRALAILALLAVAGGAGAFTFLRNESTGLPIKWPAGPIPFRIMLGEAENLSDGTSFNTTADAAAQQWNAVLGNGRFTTTLTTGTAAEGNGLNEMIFGATIFGRAFDGNTIAVATQTRSGNERIEADIVFNSGRVWNSYRGTRPGSLDPNAIDLRRVALHELGHALGLGHPDEDNQTVFAVMNSRVSSIDSLTEDDIAGGQMLYGPPGVPGNDSFANAAVLTLAGAASSTSASGHNTNATKETNEPNHAGNAGGSSVWWRWTAPRAGAVVLNTRGSVFDTTLAVYTGSAVGSLVPVTSNDDITNGVVQASEVTFNATSGTVYRIAVDGFDRDTGGITLNLNFASAGGSPPEITVQPTSLTVNTGGSANFSVTATGADLAYQWFFNGNAITGATASSFAVSNAQPANAGSYHVVVSNAGGSVTSATATLTVNSAPPPASGAGGGGGGGGGAPSTGFLVALLALLGLRRFSRRD
ncbi:MAG TPA: matrixin family metalloprotease [Opitutaceae bacterium]|nr:matrixin family metalloprotease [Opitutaceae bacterium]